jgi:hypothetical protein
MAIFHHAHPPLFKTARRQRLASASTLPPDTPMSGRHGSVGLGLSPVQSARVVSMLELVPKPWTAFCAADTCYNRLRSTSGRDR